MVWLYAGRALGVGAASVLLGVIVHETQYGRRGGEFPSVFASWTTNSEPSVKWERNWDRREPQSLVRPRELFRDSGLYQSHLDKANCTATRHLILVRHGHYTDAEDDRDCKLSQLGKEQAEMTGCRLRNLQFPYTKLLSSTMTRAVETGVLINKNLPHLALDLSENLCEGLPIPPEPPVGHWKPERKKFLEDGIRIEAAFRQFFHRALPSQENDSYEILVCHSNVIRYFVCRALQFPPEAWLRIRLYHGSITWITIRPDGTVGLRLLGDVGHMPVNKLSFTFDEERR